MPKRTYAIKDKTVRIIDSLGEHDDVPFNKSEMVDRMAEYYLKDIQDGELDDPVVAKALEDGLEIQDSGDDKSSGGIFDRFR